MIKPPTDYDPETDLLMVVYVTPISEPDFPPGWVLDHVDEDGHSVFFKIIDEE